MLDILYEDNHVICVVKEPNIPVNLDDSKDVCLMDLIKDYLKVTYNKPGNVYLGLVHRLDRPVGGVMVFAKTSKAASRLSEAIRTDKVEKKYLAVIDGIPQKSKDTLIDYLHKDTKTNTVKTTTKDRGKYASLDYTTLQTKNNLSLLQIHLHTGRSHQIRVQFSSRNLPLLHDQRYHPHPSRGQIALWSYSLSFPHPTKQTTVTITKLPPQPWHNFTIDL